jgi:hypothetical protein
MTHMMESLGSTDDRDELMRTAHGRRVLTSWQSSRLIVGVLGLVMPILLLAGATYLGDVSRRTSLSAYYHSGVRDLFVGILCVVGIFLVAYRISERRWENWLTVVAGVAAVAVATFPTETGGDLTPWQAKLGETPTGVVHGAAAVTFIGALALLSIRGFAKRDAWRRHLWYAAAHRVCGWTMLGAGATGALLAFLRVQYVAGWGVVLLVEIVCTAAFGVSWLLKGFELRTAIRKREAAPLRPVTAGTDVGEPGEKRERAVR